MNPVSIVAVCNPKLTMDVKTVAGIDLLRGLFAVFVVVSHAWKWAVIVRYGSVELPALSQFSRAIHNTIGHGGYWVIGFFVLSGFCIQQSVMNSQARGAYTVKRYSLARVTRIYPLFIFGLCLATCAWYLDQIYNLNCVPPVPTRILTTTALGLQGFFGTFQQYGQSWSITYELIYYAIWPLFLFLAKNNGSRAAVYGTGLMLALGTGVACFWKIQTGGKNDAYIPFWTIPLSSVAWFAGAWLASRWGCVNLSNSSRRTCLRVGCVGVMAVYGISCFLNYGFYHAFISFIVGYLSLPWFMLLIIGIGSGSWTSLVLLRVCKVLGVLSYPLYLLHEPIIAMLRLLWHVNGVVPSLFVGSLFLGITGFVGSALLGYPLETWVMRWRQRVLRKSTEQGGS
jgi:peptidoglycan/LPS O-acetylase OafA/YrhL